MFRLNNQFKTIYFSLIAFLGLLFIINNRQVMAMNQNNNNINQQTDGDIKLLNLINQRNNLEQQINNAQNNNLPLIEIQALQSQYRRLRRQIIIYQNKLQGIPTVRNTN
ncbi:SVM family protein [Candidatus Phytoplasma meliae]|uniref:SVM family protein n=1 Tax=Candidatus Phytoplasma meliae TaxID=1848402 RepID=A0ABS5CZ97_9MOLU|nr:SVM family protein [Candidatus Phytoplasma meliae]MBP5836226.1 SVM family protein [Candidatus Phytoplasma meliae]MBP5836287.1 SVM family protein [Candidatus Phytoplasma meliae]